jgi:hypothetical protein
MYSKKQRKNPLRRPEPYQRHGLDAELVELALLRAGADFLAGARLGAALRCLA